MRKHIIITRLFEFGGSNSHLTALIKYLGVGNIILILEDEKQLAYLENIGDSKKLKVKIISGLHQYAHLKYKFTTNVKELFHIIRSILTIQLLSIVNGFATVTINAVEPERHLYLMLLPFSRVFYILHTTPHKKYTSFTSATCNITLGRNKKIITVSKANKNTICTNWEISAKKNQFIEVVYNCITKNDLSKLPVVPSENGMRMILTMGHVVAYKNPLTWLETAKLATSKYHDVHFIWLGNGPLFEEFKIATSDNPRITFYGLVHEPQTFLKNALIYYQPSLYETHGIAVIEAMAHCLPCVVSDVGGLPESVENNRSGFLVRPLDKNEHLAAISRLLENARLRMEFGKNGYSKYEQFFTFEAFIAKMDYVYQNKRNVFNV